MDRPYTLAEDEAPSRAVYSAVAAAERRSPLDLTPLAEATDPDALDAFLDGSGGTGRISFGYCGYDVTVTPTEVRLAKPDG
jgi:hypothetical protein